MQIGVGTRLALSAAVFGVAVWFVDIRKLVSVLGGANPAWLLLALVANVASVYLVAGILSLLCRGNPSAWRVFRVNLVSIYFSTFLPGDIAAGLASRIRYLDLASWQEVVNRTIAERLVFLASYSVLVAAAFSWSRFWPALGPMTLLVPAGVFLAASVGLMLSRRPEAVLRLFPWARARLLSLAPKIPIAPFHASPWAFALSIVAQLVMSVVPYALLRSLGVEMSYLDAVVLGYLLTLAQLVPFFFAGIGIRDVSSIALMATLGIASEMAVAFSTLMLAIILLLAVIGGLVQLAAEGKVKSSR